MILRFFSAIIEELFGARCTIRINNYFLSFEIYDLHRKYKDYFNLLFSGAVSLFYPHLDTCCKMHDQCPIFVKRGECDYGVCNPSKLTPILSCACENEFKNCLKSLPPASFSAEIPITWIERLQASPVFS